MPDPYMQHAIELAERAAASGEVPVGAVIVKAGTIIAAAANTMRSRGDATAHAELEALKIAAASLGGRLTDCDLYVTLEPCAMCAGAISHARIRRLYYGAPDPKGGAVDNGVRFFSSPTCHHAPEVIGGLAARHCALLLKRFFAARR
ncbi:MAG: nucleoside deaminase [Alphaproteobacteria bacterium]|nr:nucleoside deaminase [Alphaproteobacteria bacterium]